MEPGKIMGSYTASAYSAVYGPWLVADWAPDVNIPPSAAVAGAVCTTDRERGVWKAPANIGLKGGVQPKERVSDTLQGDYNKQDKPLNLIRVFQGTDPLIWGARTLATDTDRWRYVPVRRLFNAVEKDIGRAMHAAMFEPNSQPTWEKVRAAIDNYLHAVWRQGGLQGSKPDEAYFVQIGLGLTMTQDEIDDGRLIVKIGLAPVRPAEFIILQMTQDMASVPA
ncbi:phage tail sheath family protein [Mycetohabitans endofungorum]|uniref:phage tail sheath family protein n=1 Tax=Mycetohabitans endofungorum TaxID=417203 RepID=UPI0030D13D09